MLKRKEEEVNISCGVWFRGKLPKQVIMAMITLAFILAGLSISDVLRLLNIIK